MLVKTTAVGLLGMLSDAKEIQSIVNQLASGKRGEDRRLIYSRDSRVEGEVFKINPSLDVNQFKVWRKEIEEDIRSIERALFSFNINTHLTGESITVSEAIKEADRCKVQAAKTVKEMFDNISSMRMEGDDTIAVSIPELVDEALMSIKSKRYLKNKIAQINARSEVELNIENQFLLEVAHGSSL
jgi:hypothetical protein